MKHFHVVTIHPSLIDSAKTFGVFKAASQKSLAEIHAIDLRDFAVDKHGSIDDAPYGGGDGMVMRPEPLTHAVESVTPPPLVITTSPGGKHFTQKDAETLVSSDRPIVLIAGRFAGMDQRFIDSKVDLDYSLGDFVLAGGEFAILAILEATIRLIPGVLGHEESAVNDSFSPGCNGLLEAPLYTRPAEFRGLKVPNVLLSGDHKAIQNWRLEESKAKTRKARPQLLK